MKATNIDHVTTMAKLGEAVAALVKESGVLRKKAGRKRGKYKKRRARKAKAARGNGIDRSAKRKRPLGGDGASVQE